MADDKYFDFVFDKWADSYDQTVYNDRGEYAEVFSGYERIISSVVDNIGFIGNSYVIDIGSGTGNLAYEAFKRGYMTLGVEPNETMRRIAGGKYPQVEFVNGDFLRLPVPRQGIGALISSYAFHHLRDEDKKLAAGYFSELMPSGGRVVIADTMYKTHKDMEDIKKDSRDKGYLNLYADLDTEYYTTHRKLKAGFEAAGFSVSFERMNKFVWILRAIKKESV